MKEMLYSIGDRLYYSLSVSPWRITPLSLNQIGSHRGLGAAASQICSSPSKTI